MPYFSKYPTSCRSRNASPWSLTKVSSTTGSCSSHSLFQILLIGTIASRTLGSGCSTQSLSARQYTPLGIPLCEQQTGSRTLIKNLKYPRLAAIRGVFDQNALERTSRRSEPHLVRTTQCAPLAVDKSTFHPQPDGWWNRVFTTAIGKHYATSHALSPMWLPFFQD